MRQGLEVLGWLTALLLFAFAGHAALAQEEAERPAAARTSRPQRVRRLGEADAESPASIMRAARTLYVRPSARVDKKYIEYKLQKYTELRDWGLMIVEDERAADLVLKVDQTALNYLFSITDPRTSIVVVSGKVVAINDLVAAEYLGKELVRKIKEVRASVAPERRAAGRKRDRDPDADNDAEDEDAP